MLQSVLYPGYSNNSNEAALLAPPNIFIFEEGNGLGVYEIVIEKVGEKGN